MLFCFRAHCIYRSSRRVVLRWYSRRGLRPWKVSNSYVVRTRWMPVRLHLTSDAISRWEVDALSNASIFTMSMSDKCSPLRRRPRGSVMVVGCDGDGGVGERVIIEIYSGGRVHVAGTVYQLKFKISSLLLYNDSIYSQCQWQILDPICDWKILFLQIICTSTFCDGINNCLITTFDKHIQFKMIWCNITLYESHISSWDLVWTSGFQLHHLTQFFLAYHYNKQPLPEEILDHSMN